MSSTTPAQPGIIKYVIESTDVLDQVRVNISEERSNKILWYKKRHISEEEIVESVIDNTDKSVKWTIHKPRDGWYLRLRPPTFPPNVFISLVPPPRPVKASELPTTNRSSVVKPEEEGSLTFVVRTLPPKASDGLPPTSSTHSYPPSPSTQSPTIQIPPVTSPPPKMNEVNARSNKIIPSPTNVSITRFLLSPSLPLPISPTAGVSGFLSRTLAFFSPPIKSHVSFSLAAVSARGDPYSSPLLTFVEQTSVFSVATAGILTIDKTIEQQMGIETSFWVAVSLAYLEFLSDRDSYLAAANG